MPLIFIQNGWERRGKYKKNSPKRNSSKKIR